MSRGVSVRSITLLIFGGFLLLGQSDRGSISGTVSDSTGAVIPGAKVIVTNPSTNATLSTTSSESGDYTAPNLPVGIYSVRVEREGFKPALLNNVNVNAGLNARGDITLEVGASQQVVEVQAQAAALQTEDAKAATTITNKLVDDLPLVVGGAFAVPSTWRRSRRKPRTSATTTSPWAADSPPATAPILMAFQPIRHAH